jgi:hypothetical protein
MIGWHIFPSFTQNFHVEDPGLRFFKAFVIRLVTKATFSRQNL